MSEIRAKDIALVNINLIKPNPKNRNIHPQDQIDKLAQIIKYQGFRTPVIVSNRSGYLVAGHGRLLAAKSLGMTELPVLFQDFESDEQEYAAQVSDNAVAFWSELDLSGINTDLADLGPDFDIQLLGLKSFTLDPSDFEEPEPKDDPKLKEALLKQCPNCGVTIGDG